MSQLAPPISAPAVTVIDVSVLRQFTGQDTVTDPATAQRQYESAKAAHATAEQQLKRLNRAAQYRRIRLSAARKGIAGWIAALIAGSAVALVLAVALIFIAGAGLGLVFVGVLSAYLVIGGAAFWFFRPLDGETEENRVQVRTDRLKQSDDVCRSALRVVQDNAAAADKALNLLRSINQALQSEANKRLVETNRLLSVEAGRLYPDEFERYVGDIFRHLGFTIEVTGRSGDQGVDVLACRGAVRVAIQAKRYIDSVGNSAVQQVYAGMAHHRCHRCAVITTSGFTPGAIALAQSTGCILIGLDRIRPLILGEIPF
jgi:HJR/Mrr/RecB family endonuclease